MARGERDVQRPRPAEVAAVIRTGAALRPSRPTALPACGPARGRPRWGRGLIDIDFAFHVDSAAYELRNPHDHGPGHRSAGTTRTKRGARGPAAEAGST